MQRIKRILKNEIVLFIAAVLAIISSVVVGVDKKYAEYIDFRTLGILFCLMVVVAGFRSIGIFDKLAAVLLKRVNNMRSLFLVLVLLCFFGSMLITNDVALITFVPLTIIILKKQTVEMQNKWLIPLISLETIGANLGSMLTPIGNPQNLYLYTKANDSFISFIGTMLPYSMASCIAIIVWIIVITRKNEEVHIENQENDKEGNKNNGLIGVGNTRLFIIYLVLFVISLMVVLRVINYIAVLLITVISTIIFDRKILKRVDYSLLLTFAAFFIFVGNIERIEVFNSFFERVVVGREVGTGIILSQIISNVPATLLLSGFTANYKALLIGVNIGGLGTLIASMASLISYKFLAKEEGKLKGKYFAYFTLANVIFLTVLVVFYVII